MPVPCAPRYALRAPKQGLGKKGNEGQGELLIECELLSCNQATLVRGRNCYSLLTRNATLL